MVVLLVCILASKYRVPVHSSGALVHMSSLNRCPSIAIPLSMLTYVDAPIIPYHESIQVPCDRERELICRDWPTRRTYGSYGPYCVLIFHTSSFIFPMHSSMGSGLIPHACGFQDKEKRRVRERGI